jgi:uncharacterized protein YukE
VKEENNMAADQKFNFSEASNLKGKLSTEVNNVETQLKQMMRMVEGVTSWWSGGSEKAFIENFRSTKDNIVTSLNKCIQDYKTLVDQIIAAKQESDTSIANQLNKR